MATHTPMTEAIRDRAAQWVTRVNDNDLSEAEREDLQSWLLADPRHALEFRAHNALLGLARDFPTDVQATLEAHMPVMREQKDAFSHWARPLSLAAAAAALLAVVAVGWLKMQPLHGGKPETQLYATRTGENLTVTLEDGSVASLNTRTRLEWVATKYERRVYLTGSGEALFDVVHDASRPFVVMLENSEIHVLGTKFNVYRKPDGEVTVTVMEGKVAVQRRADLAQPRGVGDEESQTREVSANQQLVYSESNGLRDARKTPAAVSAALWREGLMKAEDEPLPEMVDEFRRYTNKQIEIRDRRVAQMHAGGVFTVRNVGIALGDLAKLVPITVTETDAAFTIDYRNE